MNWIFNLFSLILTFTKWNYYTTSDESVKNNNNLLTIISDSVSYEHFRDVGKTGRSMEC